MLCIIATSQSRAHNWADNQGLERDEWFCPQHIDDLKSRQDYHTIVIDSFPDYRLGWFETIYHIAKQNGRINRK